VKGLLRFLIGACLVLVLSSLWSAPAVADHGTFHKHQHSRDAGSCCIEVRAHTRCSTNCDYISAAIRKSGTWYSNVCNSWSDDCYEVYSPWRAYSPPITVYTYHDYDAGGTHFGDDYLTVWYP
jgi:hypothetical protein